MIIPQTNKELLAKSLQELSAKKNITKITIKEITQNCCLSSQTFYNYFSDKYELVAWIYNQKVEKNFATKKNFEEILIGAMEILLEDEIFYKNALKNVVGQNSFRYTTNDFAIKLMINQLKKVDEEKIFLIKFYMRGVSDLINEWFLSGDKKTPQEMAKLFLKAIPESLKGFL